MKYKILQICPPSSSQSVYAAYSETGDRSPRKKADIFIKPCPALALIEEADGRQRVLGLVVGDDRLEEPAGENFLGYVSSKQEAFGQYLPLSGKRG